LLYVLALGGIGLLFLIAAPALDPDLAIVGLILIGVAAAMAVIFIVLAYRRLKRHGQRPPECSSDRRQ
jgi:hypothetical protein